jgi:hypothetical protein
MGCTVAAVLLARDPSSGDSSSSMMLPKSNTGHHLDQEDETQKVLSRLQLPAFQESCWMP